jgi:hypothetical protein
VPDDDFSFSPDTYSVEIDGKTRRIDRVPTARHELTPEQQTYQHLAERLLDATEPPRPPTGIFGLIWRILVRVLGKLGPTDPPHIVAIIKAPERMHCVHCGTQRVARYCPICGRDVDRQYRRLVRQMSRLVVDGTADRRAALEAELKAHVEQQVDWLRTLQTNMLKARLAKLERDYTMELARQKRQLRSMSRELARQVLLEELKHLRTETPALMSPAIPSAAGSTWAPNPRPRRGR